MKAKEYYYSEENKINPRHDLPEGVIVLKEEELFQLMEDFAKNRLNSTMDVYVEKPLFVEDYLTPKEDDTTGDTTE